MAHSEPRGPWLALQHLSFRAVGSRISLLADRGAKQKVFTMSDEAIGSWSNTQHTSLSVVIAQEPLSMTSRLMAQLVSSSLTQTAASS